MKGNESSRRIDVVAYRFVLPFRRRAYSGFAQVGIIPAGNRIGTLVIALMFVGLVQILAGITDIRYNEQLGGTALTMYGFFRRSYSES